MADARHPRVGVEEWTNARNGLKVIRLHYTCDARKRTPEWKVQASANMHPRAWRREYEIDWAAPAGDPVIPEYQEAKHCRVFPWHPELRLLRFWDFGFVSPVCLFAQQMPWGQLRIRRELCPFNTPLDQLLGAVDAVTLELGGVEVVLDRQSAWDAGGADSDRDRETPFDAGDPAGTNQTDLGASAEVLGRRGIVLHTTRPGLEVSYANLRQRFLRDVMEPGAGPQPSILVHPDCHNLRAALSGAFHLNPLPPHRPVRRHPETDVVDALRYGEDNLRLLAGPADQRWQRVATQDMQHLRALQSPIDDDSWQATQRERWRAIVEGM